MLYTIESTLGGFGDVLVEIFALPKACHSGSVLPLLPLWQGFAHHSAAKTVAVLANSFATLMGAESFWWSSILVILIIVHVILTVFNFPPNNFVHICGHCCRSNASTVDCTGSRILSNCVSPPIHINLYRLHTRCI